MSIAYVDASALVKLFKPERETEAFRRALRDWLGALFVYDEDLYAAA